MDYYVIHYCNLITFPLKSKVRDYSYFFCNLIYVKLRYLNTVGIIEQF